MILIGNAIRGYCRLITTEPFSVDLLLDMIEEHHVCIVQIALNLPIFAKRNNDLIL